MRTVILFNSDSKINFFIGMIFIFLFLQVISFEEIFPLISFIIDISIGSPKIFPSKLFKLLHPNKILITFSSQSIQDAIKSSLSSKFITPKILNSLVVRVPIRSKQHISIFPAYGIFEGSVHIILFDSK